MTLRHQSSAAGFPVRLKETRLAAGLTQAELGLRIGIKVKQVMTKLERGQTGPTAERVVQLAAALGVSPTWLAFGHECEKAGGSPEGWQARLREARKQAQLQQSELAQRLGYRRAAAIALLEGGWVKYLDLSLAEKAAVILGTSPEWLAFGHPCE